MIVFVVLAGCAGPAGDKQTTTSAPPAADGDAGTIEGNVQDTERQPIGGVPIVLFGAADFVRRTTSDDLGHFRFDKVPVGSYKLLASLVGYRDANQNIDVFSGEVAKVQFLLDKIMIRPPHPDYYKEENGTIQGPVYAFTGPFGNGSKMVPFQVDEWPRIGWVNLTWELGPAGNNYLNMEVRDADDVQICRQAFGDKLSCKLESFPKTGTWKVHIYAWSVVDTEMTWNVKILLDY